MSTTTTTTASAPAGAPHHPTRGGTRSHAGRPPTDRVRGSATCRVTMRCHAEDLAYLHELGNGNVSAGLRACITLAQQQQLAQHTMTRPGWPSLRTRAARALAGLLPVSSPAHTAHGAP